MPGSKTRSRPLLVPVDVVADTVSGEAVGDGDVSGGGAAQSASFPSPGTSSPESEAADARLAEVPEPFRSDELVAEVHRAANAATAHRLLTEAVTRAAGAVTDALAATPPDVETAATAHAHAEALSALRQRLDFPNVRSEVAEPLVEAAALALRSAGASLTVTTPDYRVDVARYESLRSHPRRDITAPILTELDATADKVYGRIIAEAARLADSISEVLRARSSTGDVLSWLSSAGVYLEQVQSLADRVAEANTAIVTANVWRKSGGYTWAPPDGVFVDTAVGLPSSQHLLVLSHL